MCSRQFWLLILMIGQGELRAEDGVAFFESRIRPILVQHCDECHSTVHGELKGNLSLENSASMLQGGDSGPVYVAGKPEASLIIDALKYDGIEMPPSGRLPEAVVRDFEQWIAMGAPDPRTGESAAGTQVQSVDIEAGRQFWSFRTPEEQTVPEVKDQSWPETVGDHLVLAQLEASGLTPSPDVDHARLLRRVRFDLTGLPPTREEYYAHIANPDPQKLELFVDRLMATREFAEHWARHWLDVARYADSNGGDFNATFHDGWRYRNYVIEVFANDLPYHQFIREQLAGDLLPASDEEAAARQLIATGFLALGPKMLSERDKLKLKMDVIDEQVDTMGKTFLGMTLGCARCHDHKFDPIPTSDYYALAGFFDSVDCLDGEIQQYVSDYVRRPLPIDPSHAAAIEKHNLETQSFNRQILAAKEQLKQAESELNRAKSSQSMLVVDDLLADKTGDWKASTHTRPFVGAGYLHDDNREKGKKRVVYSLPIQAAGVYDILFSYTPGDGRSTNTPVAIRHAQGTTTVRLNQRKAPDMDGRYVSLGKYTLAPGSTNTVEVSTDGTDGHVIVDAVACLSLEPVKPVPPVDLAPLEFAVRDHQNRVKTLEKQVQELAAHAPPAAPMAISVREKSQPVDCAICVRGEPKQRGAIVPRGFLQVAQFAGATAPAPHSSGRRELADWIASPKNPLTARVYVNRVWQKLMGEGLVRSVDNFGRLGDRPTHPELLDYLTLEFIKHGWSTKWLVREIVLSRTYRQDSRDRPEAATLDPENRLLWRAHRKRLIAEEIRDSLLVISGQMQPSTAGSPVQGLGKLVDDNQAQSKGYQRGDTPVRSIYLPVIRNEVSPLLTVFDFADPDFVVGRRESTTIPAQSLTLLNLPFVALSAKQTAGRMLQDASPSLDQQLEWAAITVWGRPPEAGERQRIRDYLNQVGPRESTQSDALHNSWSLAIHAMFASSQFQFLD